MQGYLFERTYGRLDDTQRALYAGKMREDVVARRMHQRGFPLNIEVRELHRKRLDFRVGTAKGGVDDCRGLAGKCQT